MAIKVGGTTVIDDNRCLCNIQDACITGTLTAGTIVGDGSQLTGVGGGGPTAAPLYMTLSPNSAAVSKGEPVSVICYNPSCAGYDCVQQTLGSPSIICDCTVNFTSDTGFGPTNCAETCEPWAMDGYCAAFWGSTAFYQSCRCECRIRFSSAPAFSGWKNKFRIAQNKYVEMEYSGGIGYCCRECFDSITSNSGWNCLDCITSLAGSPTSSNFQVPCMCLAQYNIDSTNKTLCKVSSAHVVPTLDWATVDQQCVQHSNICLLKGILGLPINSVAQTTSECYRCCCTLCCSGLKRNLYSGVCNVINYIQHFCNSLNFCTNPCCEGTCGYSFTYTQTAPFNQLDGPLSNLTMNLPSCTGTKFYSMMPVSVQKSSGCTSCSGANVNMVTQCTQGSQMAFGLLSFCLCSGTTDLDASTVCMQQNLLGDWRMGYISKNKRFMFGEHSKVAACSFGYNCHCNRGCGFIYVNEINDSFIPNPQCGCIATTNRLIEFGLNTNQDTPLVCTEQEWRFWPTGETCDGWVIATQPIEVICYINAYCSQCKKSIRRDSAYLKVIAIKPIATGSACISNVVCICHRFSTDGGICWGHYNGVSDSCVATFTGLDNLSCDIIDGTKGAFIIFDHDDNLSSSMYTQYMHTLNWDEVANFYGKGMCMCSCLCADNGEGRIPSDGSGKGSLPQAILQEVYGETTSNCICMCLANLWIGANCSCNNIFPGGNNWPSDCPGCGTNSCCRATSTFSGRSCIYLCIDNSTNCLTISSCVDLTQFCIVTYTNINCCQWANRHCAFRCSIFDSCFLSVLKDSQFRQVNLARNIFAFGNGNSRRFVGQDMCIAYNTCQCCDWARTCPFGSFLGHNNCCGSFCGCNLTNGNGFEEERHSCNRPAIHGCGLIDPLAFTWVTDPHLDKGRFTADEDYVYSICHPYCCMKFHCCSNKQKLCIFADGRNFRGDCCVYRCHSALPVLGAGYQCSSQQCCHCYDYSVFKIPASIACDRDGGSFWCSGLVKHCSSASVDTCVCTICAENITSDAFCQTAAYAYGTDGFFLPSEEATTATNCDYNCYKYMFVAAPEQNNLACFVGWATEDTNPGSKVPIMTLDRGFLPLDSTMQGWCDIDLSGCVAFKQCIQIVSGNCNTWCITCPVYDTYTGACCLASSPFRTCTFCNFACSYQIPVLCFAVDSNCCCCAYVTTQKTVGQ